LRDEQDLRSLFRKAEAIGRLQMLLDMQLQPAARPHCKLAMYREGVLLLIVTDGHWATRLRYQQKRLLKALQALPQFESVRQITFKVQPPVINEGLKREIPLLSDAAAESIQATAECISDPKLRAAMERLASHTKKKTNPDP
jgi:hypothetical protein